MSNLKNTLALNKALIDLGIDIDSEIEVSSDPVPSVSDCLAVLKCARALLVAGIPLMSHSRISEDALVVSSKWEMEGNKRVVFGSIMEFDTNLKLQSSNVSVLFPADKKEDNLVEHFDDVDIAMFTSIPRLVAPLTNYIYRMVFNGDYEEYVTDTAIHGFDDLKGNYTVLLNGQPYAELVAGPVKLNDKETGIIDILLLQAVVLIRDYPECEVIDFRYDEDLRVLVVNMEF